MVAERRHVLYLSTIMSATTMLTFSDLFLAAIASPFFRSSFRSPPISLLSRSPRPFPFGVLSTFHHPLFFIILFSKFISFLYQVYFVLLILLLSFPFFFSSPTSSSSPSTPSLLFHRSFFRKCLFIERERVCTSPRAGCNAQYYFFWRRILPRKEGETRESRGDILQQIFFLKCILLASRSCSFSSLARENKQLRVKVIRVRLTPARSR